MDVAHTNFTKLGGVVDIESTVGEGCVIRIKLPLTLAIIPSLITRVHQEHFALPQTSIVELVSLSGTELSKQVKEVAGTPFLHLRDTLLPLIDLGDLLAGEPTQVDRSRADSVLSVAVVAAGELHFGLVVSEFLDSEEIVVKPLGHHIKSCPAYSGATIRGNGRVALILNVTGICQSLKLAEDQAQQLVHEGEDEEHLEEGLSLILFQAGDTGQLALPLDLVSRIEQVEASKLEKVAGQWTLRNAHSTLPLIAPDGLSDEVIRESRSLYVFVYKYSQIELGLLATGVIDVRNTDCPIDTQALVTPSSLGSVVVNDHTTLIVDLFGVTREHYPRIAAAADEATLEESSQPLRVMVVDDSRFYRQQISSYVKESGAEVSTADDGVQALDRLKGLSTPVDILLTDIEMPNMNGIELIKQVRRLKAYKETPIIAITSLTGRVVEDEILNAGANKYMVKLAKDDILDLLRQYRKNKPTGVNGS